MRLLVYAQLAVDTLLGVLLLLPGLAFCAVGLLVAFGALFGEDDKSPLMLVFAAPFLFGGLACTLVIGRWSVRVVRRWPRLVALLGAGRALPMDAIVHEERFAGHGRYWVHLLPVRGSEVDWRPERFALNRFFGAWLTMRSPQRVFVHGARGAGPFVIESKRGGAAVLVAPPAA